MSDPEGKKIAGVAASETDGEDIVELTDVVSEENVETLIELPPELQVLDSLDFKSLLGEDPAEPAAEEAPEEVAAAPEAEEEPNLDELLGPLAEASGAEEESEQSDAEAEATDLAAMIPVVESHTVEEIVQKVLERFDEARLREIIEPIIVETVARLCRELFPAVAEAALMREIEALKEGAAESADI